MSTHISYNGKLFLLQVSCEHRDSLISLKTKESLPFLNMSNTHNTPGCQRPCHFCQDCKWNFYLSHRQQRGSNNKHLICIFRTPQPQNLNPNIAAGQGGTHATAASNLIQLAELDRLHLLWNSPTDVNRTTLKLQNHHWDLKKRAFGSRHAESPAPSAL